MTVVRQTFQLAWMHTQSNNHKHDFFSVLVQCTQVNTAISIKVVPIDMVVPRAKRKSRIRARKAAGIR
jgi:hypothetical protein